MATAEAPPRALSCPACGADVAQGLRVCPACHALVHAEALKRLAAEAESAEAGDDVRTALGKWREALDLLPPTAVQSKRIGEKVVALSRRAEALPVIPEPPREGSPKGTWWAGLGGLGVLLWKLKFVALFVLTKAKLLLFGLSQSATIFSMLASAGVYWTLWGWKFAVGLVICMYIHEIGHVAAFQRLGIEASPPMFVPGFGAYVRGKQYPVGVREDAYVGLAGPLWGAGAAIACVILWLATGQGLWAGLAEWSARLNLLNLAPAPGLDGGRGFRALSRAGRGLVLMVMGAAFVATGEKTLVIVLVIGLVRLLGGEAPAISDRRALAQFAGLAAFLAALCRFTGHVGA